MEKTKNKINFRKHPYRGILTEIASEEDVTRQSVYQSIRKTGNPRILQIFKEKLIERERHYESVRIR